MQYSGGPYTLTIFVSEGLSTSSAAGQSSSGNGLNLGHVFVELTNGSKQMYIGYYGDPANPARGQLRPDADLASQGAWDVKETYSITQEGYNAAHWLIDQWGTDGVTWALNHNCADFAEAIAQISGGNLHPPKMAGINRPILWGKYLRAHGGTLNPTGTNSSSSSPASGSSREGGKISDDEYRKEFDVLVARQKADQEAWNRCFNTDIQCHNSCSSATLFITCLKGCDATMEQCEVAPNADLDKVMEAFHDLAERHSSH
jgi:hypothetical protein